MVVPEQTFTEVALAPTIGRGFTKIALVAVVVQAPFAPITLYVVEELGVKTTSLELELPAFALHEYPFAPLTLSVKLVPAQTKLGPEILIVGVCPSVID